MRLTVPLVAITGLILIAVSGCNQARQPETSVLVGQPSFKQASSPGTTPSPKSIRLPLVANGSDLTPTPFQPATATLVNATSTGVPPNPASDNRLNIPSPSTREVTAIPPQMPLLGDQGRAEGDLINILLIGADQRSGTLFRTDTLIIASIRPKEQVVTLISIPRDLFVYIPGWTMQRINTAYLHGQTSKYPGRGPALLKETILYNLGVRIDHIAIVNFDGFRKIVDTLGGIDLPLFCPYTDWKAIDPKGNLENPANWRMFTVEPGLVHMDGELALWYARSRLHSNDYDRGRRQQEVLRGIYAKAMKLNIIPHIPELYQQVGDAIKTDMGLEDILALAPIALSLDAPRIRSFYINNRLVKAWWTPAGANVLLPKLDKIQALLQEAMSPPDAGEADRLATLIEVSNATSNTAWDLLAAERLHYAGFETRFVSTTNPNTPKKTWMYDLSGGHDPQQAAVLLALMGLPGDHLLVETAQPGPAQYRLVLGSDYNPCFNPSKFNK